MNVKPAIGFLTKDGEAPFTDKVTTILKWMTGNDKYKTPSPTLDVVQTAFDAYKVATADASQGGKENTAIRDARRAELVALLRQLANYVSATANGDMETLLSSGFPTQKPTRTPIGPLPAPHAARMPGILAVFRAFPSPRGVSATYAGVTAPTVRSCPRTSARAARSRS